MIDITALRNGDRKALAKAITLVESVRGDHRLQSEKLIQEVIQYSGNSIRIGLTGVPGVGKSSLIEVLGNHIIDLGHKVAVLAVDPSSTMSGGSILGDKTRMPTLSINHHAFIRPTPTAGTLGGVARRTRESILLCEAAGFDVIFVETVGVGQSETLVSQMTDIFVLMLLPGGGDELQGVKRGIMELADLVVINKADGDMQSRAKLSAADITQALGILKQRNKDWNVPVLTTSVLENQNIDKIWDEIKRYKNLMDATQALDLNRKSQAKSWLWAETNEMLVSTLKEDARVMTRVLEMEKKVENGMISPSAAASTLVSEFLTQIN